MSVFSLCVYVSLLSGQEQKSAPRAIAVVKSWEELEKQPVLELGERTKIRLGLEAAKAPRWSGVLVYCLCEGDSGYAGPIKGIHLGPTELEIVPPNKHEPRALIHRLDRSLVKKSLFVGHVAVDRPGKYVLRVWNNKEQVVAEATVEGTEERFHPWTPWFAETAKPRERLKGIGVPDWRSLTCSLDATFPKFIPDQPSEGFKIAVADDKLVLTLPEER